MTKARGNQQWRKRYMVARKMAIGMIHRNLIAAYPDRETWLLKISALNVFNDEIKKKIRPAGRGK